MNDQSEKAIVASDRPSSETEKSRESGVARRILEKLGSDLIRSIEGIGDFMTLAGRVVFWSVQPPYRFGLIFRSMEYVGFGSLFIVLLTGLFTGMVFALQGAVAFTMFDAEAMMGAVVTISLTRELAPVLTALMVAGRAGSGIATELGTMRVTEQIDALEAMAVNPVQYLCVPKVIAGMLMVPMLTMLFNLVGIVGSFLVGVGLRGIDAGTFTHYAFIFIDAKDIWSGLIKGAVFGALIALIGCYKGFNATGGAQGVGEATTRSVVTCSVTILAADYFLSSLIW